MVPENGCLNVTYEMLQAYKIKVAASEFPSVDVPVELLLWLIQRAQLWERLAHNERAHGGSEV
ncbi:MAG: hypothetical protein AB7L09_02865 [Nitrospira sp.]